MAISTAESESLGAASNIFEQSIDSGNMQRRKVKNYSSAFDWVNLIKHYEDAYGLAYPS